MIKFFLFHLIILGFVFASTAQSPCTNAKLVSQAVSKPTGGSIVAATCSNLMVQWQGAANQSYTANVSAYNTATNKWDTAYATGTCNSSQVCTATLPVTAGTKVSWSVQAQQVVNGRTLYSYYFIGERDYLIPACTQVITRAKHDNDNVPDVPFARNELVIYPNPATNEITIQWNSEYRGTAVIAISDAAGKEVRVLKIAKEGIIYASRVAVSHLVAGLYYVQVKPQSGQPLTGRFLKQ